jgi:phage terminase large subunit
MDNCIIYPDASGASRQHARGESSFQVLRERGFGNIKAHRKNPYVIDRINAMNRMLRDATGRIRLRVNSSCVRTIESMEQTVYKDGTNDLDKSMGTDHGFDAASYPIAYEFPVRKHVITGLSL